MIRLRIIDFQVQTIVLVDMSANEINDSVGCARIINTSAATLENVKIRLRSGLSP